MGWFIVAGAVFTISFVDLQTKLGKVLIIELINVNSICPTKFLSKYLYSMVFMLLKTFLLSVYLKSNRNKKKSFLKRGFSLFMPVFPV